MPELFTVEVVDIRVMPGDGNLRALCDVLLGGQLVIRAVTVMQGKNGLFVSMPRKAAKDGRWYDTAKAEKPLMDSIEKAVLEAYEKATANAA